MSFSQLRPLSFGELLDGAFTLYRRHFSTLVLIALVPSIPAILIYLLAGAGVFGSAANPMAAVGVAVVIPVSLLASVITWGGLTYFVGRAYTGMPVAAGDALKAAGRRYLPLLAASIIAGIMWTVGFVLCFVPGLFAMCACFAFVAAVMLERRGPIDAISRSIDLVKGAWGEVFLVLIVVYLIAAMPGFAVGAATMVASLVVAKDPSRTLMVQAISGVLSQLVNALTAPFSATAMVLLYYDRRVRTEALDVQMMAESLGGYPEHPAPGWG